MAIKKIKVEFSKIYEVEIEFSNKMDARNTSDYYIEMLAKSKFNEDIIWKNSDIVNEFNIKLLE